MTDEQKQSERTIDKLHRETGIPMWALETAFELSTLGMLDEETMAGLRVIPDAARVIAGCNPATFMRSACIEKVKEMADDWLKQAIAERDVERSDKLRMSYNVAQTIIEALKAVGEQPCTTKSN